MSWVALLSVLTAPVWPAAAKGVRVSGRVRCLEGNDHVSIQLVGDRVYRATSGCSGLWAAEGVEPGSYVVTPYHARYVFDPPRRTVVVPETGLSDVDFTARPRTESSADPTPDAGDTETSLASPSAADMLP